MRDVYSTRHYSARIVDDTKREVLMGNDREDRPLGWSEYFPVPTVRFLDLNDQERQGYIELREQIGAMLNQPNGLQFVLNAIVAKSGETVTQEIYEWLVAVIVIDPRDLNAMCYGIPPDAPQRIITSHIEM